MQLIARDNPQVADPSVPAGGPSDAARQKMPVAIICANTMAFAVAFAAWVLFGPSVRFIAKDLRLSLPLATLVKTLPILVGSVMRVPLGILADRLGARLVFLLLLTISAAGIYTCSLADSVSGLIVMCLISGLAGTTFVVGVQSVSSWTPRKSQGFALGIFGAGNAGTALTTFCLPWLLTSIGWRGSFQVYAVMLAATGAAYWLVVRNAPRKGAAPNLRTSLAPLASLRAWRFGLYYMATFGVFVATTLTITDIYIDSYHVSVKNAGLLATIFTFSTSLVRMAGGKLADRFGARQVVRISLMAVTAALIPVAFSIPLTATVILVFIAGLAMGTGMAGTFRYIPDYFPDSVGAVGGVVGALGGLGGFFLPQIGAAAKAFFGESNVQVIPLALLAAVAAVTQYLAIGRQKNGGPDGSADVRVSLTALESAVRNTTAPRVPASVGKT